MSRPDVSDSALAGRRIGPHFPVGRAITRAPDRLAEIGATAVQFFSDNPTAWRRRAKPPAGLPAFRRRVADLDIGPLSVHGPYLVNLAGADEDFWNRSVAAVVADLRMAANYGASFVNIHIGSHRGAGRDEGIRRLVAGLVAVFREVSTEAALPLLVLENSAGGGDGVGGTVEELEAIADAAAAARIDTARLGFCLDTAHLWGAGYDVRRAEVADRIVIEFDRRLGPGLLSMIHLNDSRAELGSHTDRHEHLGAGRIGPEGLRAFLLHPRLAAVPTYFETPGMDEGYDAVNMERVRLLIAGHELPELPAEAFSLKRSRPRMPSRPTHRAARAAAK